MSPHALLRRFTFLAVATLGALAPGRVAVGGLIINFTEAAELAALQTSVNPADNLRYNQVISGFNAARDIWQSVLHDNVTVNITINYESLGGSILGGASTAQYEGTYSLFQQALLDDRQSSDDYTAVASLPTNGPLNIRMNDRSGAVIDDTDGSKNNSYILISGANAKALGLLPADYAAQDASISFSSDFAFDFDRSNGIGAGLYDFIGVAAHEIGHALGFFSGVDDVDYFSGPNGPGKNADKNGAADGIGTLDAETVFTVLDLFRDKAGSPGVFDWTYGGSPGFTLDGGTTFLGGFSGGTYNGDARQASHWKDNLGLGIMDPTFAAGELGVLTNLDLRAMDVIGWNLQAVPEPGSMTLATVAVVGGYAARRRRKQLASISI